MIDKISKKTFHIREKNTLSLAQYLDKCFSKEEIDALFLKGRVKVFNYFVGKNYQLKKGDLITIQDQFPEPVVNKQIHVLYEDDHLLVIDKPAPLPAHPSGAYFHHSLTKIIRAEERGLHLVHRLDAETSGVLMFSKESKLVPFFSEALRRGQKYYLVMVEGQFPPALCVQFPLGQHLNSLIIKKQGVNWKNGKPSRTLFRRICSKKGYSLLMASPVTGRTHQIRAHLNSLGFPVVGDKIYGKDERHFLEFLEKGVTEGMKKELLLARQFLHCRKITLIHPILHKQISFTSSLPDDINTLLNDVIVEK